MKIAVTGYRGRLGYELTTNWDCYILDCDIVDESQVIHAVRSLRPDVIINCASVSDVDLCEEEVHFRRAIQVNTRGVEYLRRHFTRRLIHISTDYVFDGKSGPYDEHAEAHPVNAYGFSKYGGDVLLMTSPYPGQTVIVRTSNLYGGQSGKPDLASFVVESAHRKEKIWLPTDSITNHTYIPHLAEALIHLANMNWRHPVEVINIASSDLASPYDFAVIVGDAIEDDYVRSLISPVRCADMAGWTAKRLMRGGLKVSKAASMGIPIYSIHQGVRAYKKSLGED